MAFLIYCCIVVALSTGVLSQTCDDQKIAECKAIKDNIIASLQAPNGVTTACSSQGTFNTCIEPCKSLATDSPLYPEYMAMNAEVTGMLTTMCSGSGSGTNAACSTATSCVAALGSSTDDHQQLCTNYAKAKQCLDKFAETCKNDPTYQSMQASITSYESTCASGCDLTKLQKCMQSMDLSQLEYVFTQRDKICQGRTPFLNCVTPLQDPCRKSKVGGVAETMKSIDMILKVTHELCIKENATFAKQMVQKCYMMPNLTKDLDRCVNLSTPDGGQDETEKQQCTRLADHTTCLEKVVADDCDAEATKLTIRLGDRITRIVYEGENLVCATGGAGRLGISYLILCAVTLGLFAFL